MASAEAPEAPEADYEEVEGEEEEAEDLGGAGEIEEEAAPAPGGAGGASPGLEELRARYRGLTPQQLQQILAHQQAQRAKQVRARPPRPPPPPVAPPPRHASRATPPPTRALPEAGRPGGEGRTRAARGAHGEPD